MFRMKDLWIFELLESLKHTVDLTTGCTEAHHLISFLSVASSFLVVAAVCPRGSSVHCLQLIMCSTSGTWPQLGGGDGACCLCDLEDLSLLKLLWTVGFTGEWVSEQCFTSPSTQYRLYGRQFLQVKRPNQQYQSTEGQKRKKTTKTTKYTYPQTKYTHKRIYTK